MLPWIAAIAVGGPRLTTGDAWDAAPLVLAIGIVAVVHRAGIRLRGPTLPAAFLGGLLLDLIADAWDLSLMAVLAALGLGYSVLALRRVQAM